MNSPIKIFIIGSCVSRDPFEKADKSEFKLVNYYARSSLASLGATPYVDNKILSNIPSDWQRKMVRADMEKSIYTEIIKTNFDILLIDLIDERFSLALHEKSIHTISSEYKKALYKPNNYKYVKAASEDKLRLWCVGLKKISDYLIKKKLDSKVVINRVYWSLNCHSPQKVLDRYKEADIIQANKNLDWMYTKLSEHIPKARFINYSESELELDENHKWGLEPFHYTEKFFNKQLSFIYNLMLNNIQFTITHPLGNKKLGFPINWNMDPYKSRPWMHNFCSLRWLQNSSPNFTINVLVSFYNFHCVKKIKNNYYDSIRGDHTAAIRLNVLLKIKYEFNKINSLPGVGICNRLIIEELKNLQDFKMYRAGHNHGLMVDLALLKVTKTNPEYKAKVDIKNVIIRSSNTIDAMWHPSGLTKEHSISYQEYNLPLTIEYFELISSLNLESSAKLKTNNIIEESKRFLGYSLRSNDEYFPLGDSFRKPNINILNDVFNGNNELSLNPSELLAPYSIEEGTYENEHFFIYRKTLYGKKIHFVATCCWDSHNHKQNDDMSFCLEVDGISIFDDPGYTEFLPWEDILTLKNENSHSTISIKNKKWNDIKNINNISKINFSGCNDDGFYLEMTSKRINGVRCIRFIELVKDIIYISDSIVSLTDQDITIDRKFVLSKEIKPHLGDKENKVFLYNNKKIISSITFNSEGDIKTKEKIKYVLSDRKKVETTNSIIHSIRTRTITQAKSISLEIRLL